MDFKALEDLSNRTGHSYTATVIAAFVQRYLGGMENVLLWLMVSVGIVGTTGFIIAMILMPIFYAIISCCAIVIVSTALIAPLYIEFLYCTKDASFIDNITGLDRHVCPDKLPDHKRAELHKTFESVE